MEAAPVNTSTCPYCEQPLEIDEQQVECTACRTRYHEVCWRMHKECKVDESRNWRRYPHRNILAYLSIALAALGTLTASFTFLPILIGLACGIIALINALCRRRLTGRLEAITGIICCLFVFWLSWNFHSPSGPLQVGLQHRARIRDEHTMRMNLQVVRNALASFKEDTGTYPKHLADIMTPATQGKQVGHTRLRAKSYKGPYLEAEGMVDAATSLPKNPLVDASLPIESQAPPSSPPVAQWSYNPVNGKVRCGCTGKSLDGNQPYEKQ